MANGQDVQPPAHRRQEFIDAAARLFAKRGYHAVGINEISAELGLSGPAVYHHFASKQALLVAVLEDAIAPLLESARDLVSSLADPLETLRALIDHHLGFGFDHTAKVIAWSTDSRDIPEADLQRLRYLERLYLGEWVRTVTRLRPTLPEPKVRAMCAATIALLESPTRARNALGREELAPLLARMALSALLDAEGGSTQPAVS